jgi:hypothetical protein
LLPRVVSKARNHRAKPFLRPHNYFDDDAAVVVLGVAVVGMQTLVVVAAGLDSSRNQSFAMKQSIVQHHLTGETHRQFDVDHRTARLRHVELETCLYGESEPLQLEGDASLRGLKAQHM